MEERVRVWVLVPGVGWGGVEAIVKGGRRDRVV